jgi:co-chaperonin GroES (HSP10)
MKGIQHFIIEVKDPFKDTIEVGEVKLYVDKDISRDRSANRFGKIISTPAFSKDETIQDGYEVIFDATILYKQLYKAGTQESIHLVDVAKSWYKIEPDMIILFRENENQEWKGYGDNLMVSFITEKSKEVSFGLVLTPVKETVTKGKAIVKYRNAFLEEQEVENGQEVFINPSSGIPFFFKEETMYWIRSKDVLAV